MTTKIKLNDDADLVKEIRSQMKENGGYCPCKLPHSAENKCMCLEFKMQESGMCHCGLYEKYIIEENEGE